MISEATIVTAIRRARRARDWSQADLAIAVTEHTGINWVRSTVGKIECGDRHLGIDEAIACADVLGIPLSTLFAEPKGRR